jgi:hypothetical protein
MDSNKYRYLFFWADVCTPQWWIWPRKCKKIAKIACFHLTKAESYQDLGYGSEKMIPDLTAQNFPEPDRIRFSYFSYRLLFSISLWFCRMNLLSS